MEITKAIIDTLIACEVAASMPTLCANKEWRAAHRLKIVDIERIRQARELARKVADA